VNLWKKQAQEDPLRAISYAEDAAFAQAKIDLINQLTKMNGETKDLQVWLENINHMITSITLQLLEYQAWASHSSSAFSNILNIVTCKAQASFLRDLNDAKESIETELAKPELI
jgi:hypothetical protein